MTSRRPTATIPKAKACTARAVLRAMIKNYTDAAVSVQGFVSTALLTVSPYSGLGQETLKTSPGPATYAQATLLASGIVIDRHRVPAQDASGKDLFTLEEKHVSYYASALAATLITDIPQNSMVGGSVTLAGKYGANKLLDSATVLLWVWDGETLSATCQELANEDAYPELKVSEKPMGEGGDPMLGVLPTTARFAAGFNTTILSAFDTPSSVKKLFPDTKPFLDAIERAVEGMEVEWKPDYSKALTAAQEYLEEKGQ